MSRAEQDDLRRWLSTWATERRRGMRHFIWRHGVLRWGGFMFCLSLGVFQYAHYDAVLTTEGQWPLRTLVSLLTWMFVGYGYGRSLWRRNEALYRLHRPSEPGRLEA